MNQSHYPFTLFPNQPAPHIPGFRLVIGELPNGQIGAAKIAEADYEAGNFKLLKMDALDVAVLNACGCYEDVEVYYGSKIAPDAAEEALAKLEAAIAEEFCTVEEEEEGIVND